MSTKEIFFVFILVFSAGFIASQIIETPLHPMAIPFMAMVGAFSAVVFNRLKHLDDLNLTLKKDTSLEYIKFVSEYRTALVDIIDPSVNLEDFHSGLREANKNMIGAQDKLHVVSSDQVSNRIELKTYEIMVLTIEIQRKLEELGENKLALLKWFIDEDIGSRLNLIRYEIIDLINSEISDGSGTSALQSAIESNNKKFKALFLKILG